MINSAGVHVHVLAPSQDNKELCNVPHKMTCHLSHFASYFMRMLQSMGDKPNQAKHDR